MTRGSIVTDGLQPYKRRDRGGADLSRSCAIRCELWLYFLLCGSVESPRYSRRRETSIMMSRTLGACGCEW
jgi:hypothetical protein